MLLLLALVAPSTVRTKQESLLHYNFKGFLHKLRK